VSDREVPNLQLLARIVERAELLDNDSSIPPHEKRLLLAKFIELGRLAKVQRNSARRHWSNYVFEEEG
jgi:hypothetical protein